MAEFNATEIGTILKNLWQERDPYLQRMRVRRALIEMSVDSVNLPAVGTNVPESYKNSEMILRTMIGDVNRGVQNYASRTAANEPQVVVLPVALDASNVGARVTKNASMQERLLMSQWEAAHGREAQNEISYSQAWGRVGWYLTLPRDATWGLPDREYFEDLTDDEIETMKRSGAVLPDTDDDGRHVESGKTWLERRRKAGKANAVSENARSLFTLEAYPPDMVLPRYDRDGRGGKSLKYGFIIEEIPYSDFMPGGDIARAAAKFDKFDGDQAKFGLFVNKEGKVEGGITAGGEPFSQSNRAPWVLARFFTRNEVYYYITNTRGGINGKIIYHDEHGAGKVPLIPVPGKHTDSRRPGGEYTSNMEQVFAQVPIINQLETLLSNVATWNALGRWYVVDETGRMVKDDKGEPMILSSSEDIPGMDTGQVSYAVGEIKQLTLDADLMLALLQFYTERLDAQMPSGVTEGTAGATAAAWQVRQLLAASGELLTEAVNNHAAAVKEVMLLWIRWMRMLDEPVFSFAAPGRRSSDTNVRGLIEMDPEDLTETIRVQQAPQSAQERIVLQQQGIELQAAGKINNHQMYEEYFLSQDPEEDEINAVAQQVADVVLYGASDQIQPGSVLWDAQAAVRGRLSFRLMDRSQAFAIATAEDMVVQAEAAAQGLLPEESGNVAQAAGVVQPGLGMSLTQGGDANMGAPGR